MALENLHYASDFFNAIITLANRLNTPVHRDLMKDFVEPLTHILTCCEAVDSNDVRSKAQYSFVKLIECFEPRGQFLLLSHFLDLLIQRRIDISCDANEPNLIAFVIDQLRSKIFPTKKFTNQSSELFQGQLSCIYRKLDGVRYEDMVLGMNFYHSVVQLVIAHLISKIQISLLKTTGFNIIAEYSTQLSDFIQLRRIKNDVDAFDQEYDNRLDFLMYVINDAKKRI